MRRSLLISAVLLASWLGMQLVHECGHVLAAWLTGAQIVRVVWHPATISRTDVASNHQPLIVAWSGPIVGCLAPLLLWGVFAATAEHFAWRFFAGFCLIANGSYLGIGSFDGIGDCGDLLRSGASIWHLWVFGIVAVTSGFAFWHGLGPYFGLGPQPREITRRAVLRSMTAAALLLMLSLLLGGE